MFSSFAAQVQRSWVMSLLVAMALCPQAFSSGAATESEQKKRAALFRATRLGNFVLKLPDVPFQRLGNHLFRHCSHDLLDNLPVLEQQQRRDSLNAIPPRRIHRLIDVQFHHFQLARIVVSNLRNRRREHVARTAPFCPEVHHHRLRIAGRQHLGLKIPVGYCLNRIVSHVLCPHRLANPAAFSLSSIDLISCSSRLLVSCGLPRTLRSLFCSRRGLSRLALGLPRTLSRFFRALSGLSRNLRRGG